MSLRPLLRIQHRISVVGIGICMYVAVRDVRQRALVPPCDKPTRPGQAAGGRTETSTSRPVTVHSKRSDGTAVSVRRVLTRISSLPWWYGSIWSRQRAVMLGNMTCQGKRRSNFRNEGYMCLKLSTEEICMQREGEVNINKARRGGGKRGVRGYLTPNIYCCRYVEHRILIAIVQQPTGL